MTIEAARETIIDRFKTLFDDVNPTIPVKYPNQKFDQPDSPWVAIFIMGGTSFQANLGISNITERHVGIVQVDVMVPEDSGTKVQSELADAVGKVFSRTQLAAGTSTLVFKTPEITPQFEMFGFLNMMVRIPFRRDEKT